MATAVRKFNGKIKVKKEAVDKFLIAHNINKKKEINKILTELLELEKKLKEVHKPRSIYASKYHELIDEPLYTYGLDHASASKYHQAMGKLNKKLILLGLDSPEKIREYMRSNYNKN